MKGNAGFTLVELVASLVLLGIVGTLMYDLSDSLTTVHRDQQRKTAINALHSDLQEVVRPKLGAYPRVITRDTISAIDTVNLKDPSGLELGNPNSSYRYEPTGCEGGDLCKGYTLRAVLEREADFVKVSSR